MFFVFFVVPQKSAIDHSRTLAISQFSLPFLLHFGYNASLMNILHSQTVEYLRYLKEQGITHVPGTSKQPVTPVKRAPKAAPDPAPAAPPLAGAAPRGGLTQSVELQLITDEVAACRRCLLHRTRTRTVPGQGALRPDVMFIGEGPGANEDEQGIAFVGRAGQLLTRMIAAMGYTRDEVFIGNIVKCRPPGNRVPSPEEMNDCIPYLKRQIAIIQPKLIVCLGATAARGLVQETLPIGKARGQWREFEGIPVMLTFHPAYLLRDGTKKGACWSDLKAVLARLGKTPPKPA